MRLVVYNIEYCKGINRRWKYLDATKLMKLVKKNIITMSEFLKPLNIDVLGLIETDSGSVRTLRKSEASLFAENLKIIFWVERTKYATKSVYKVANYVPIYRKHANAILSKQPLFDTKYYLLSKGVKRLVIYTKIKLGVEGKLVDLHLFAVHLSIRKRTRKKQIKELAQLLNTCPNPKIMFGDFNIFKGYGEIEELLETTGMINTVRFTKEDSTATFPSWNPKRTIDLVLISPGIKVRNHQVLDLQLSDHLPVMVDFELE